MQYPYSRVICPLTHENEAVTTLRHPGTNTEAYQQDLCNLMGFELSMRENV